jgi:putative ABC transport system permease protein
MSGEQAYRALLRLFPPRLRKEHGHELLEAFREREQESREARRSRWRLWGFLAGDLVRAATRAWIWELRRAHRKRGDSGPGEAAVRIDTLVQDLAYAVRSFRRRPGFVAVSVVTLGLGVGATTAIWSVIDGVLLSPLPYPSADRLVQIGTLFRNTQGMFGDRLGPLSPGDVFDVQETSVTLRAAAASRLERRVLAGDGEPEELSGAGVSAAYFDVLGVEPALGRAFTSAEDSPDAPPVAVLSDGFWRLRFGADPSVIGRTLPLDGVPFTIVGVMGADFQPPEAISHDGVDVWYPLSRVGDALDDRGSFFVQGIGRLEEGVDPNTARQELESIGDRISEAYPNTPARRLGIESLHEATVGDVGRTLWVLLGGVSFLLLISCANVANLFLIRSTEREQELAVRTAVGAGRTRLVRQLLTEGLVLSAAGGAVAVGLAHVGTEAFRRWSPGGIPRLSEVGVDPGVLSFALLLSLLTGVIFSTAPAMRTLRLSADPLREHNSGAGRERARARSALVVAQIAVALVLLVGAGLLVNSFLRLQRVDPGFDTEGVAWLRVYLRGDAYTPEIRIAFLRALQEHVRAIPGVLAVGGTDNLPLTANRSRTFVSPEGLVLGQNEAPPAVSWHAVLPGTFEALGTPLLRGRSFTDADDASAPPVAVVNQAAGALLWPGKDPIGKRYVAGRPDSGGDPVTVVGLVADVRHQRLATEPEPEIYLPALGTPRVLLNVLARAEGDESALLIPLREVVRELDPALPVPQFGTLSAHAASSILEPRFYTILVSLCAGVALTLTLVGVYGSLAYSVELRAHELGVRMALGAQGRQVVATVLGRGMALVAIGLALGLGLSYLTAGAAERFVFGIGARDPATTALACGALAAMALIACLVPALRAARADPVARLRRE